MLFFSSKNTLLLSSFVLTLAACSPEVKQVPRYFVNPIPTGKFSPDDIAGGGLLLETELYSPARFMTACGWLDTVAVNGNQDVQGFRILEDYGTRKSRLSDIFQPKDSEIEGLRVSDTGDADVDEDCTRMVSRGPRHRNTFSRRSVDIEKCRRQSLRGNKSKVGKSSSIDFQNLYGRVQLNDNPLFEYGLLGSLSNSETGLPDKDGFFDALDEEVKKTLCRSIDVFVDGKKKRELKCFERTPLLFLPLLAYQALLRTRILSPLTERNKLAKGTIQDEMPGAYDTEFQLYKLKDTFPDVIVKNGSPYAQILTPLPTDSEEELKRKDEEMRKVLGALAKRVPMFRDNTWASFQEDMRWGLSTAIRGMQSVNPLEQACASAIFHRAFAQMLTVKGYDRPPTKNIRTEKGNRRLLVDLEDFLVDPKGQKLKGCRATGSFTRDGRFTQVRDSEMAEMDSKGPALLLSAEPQQLGRCELGQNNEVLASLYPDTKNKIAQGRHSNVSNANLNQKLEFMSGMAYFTMAFTPGSKWWFSEDALVSYPLSDFASTSVSDMLASGGLMPYESFALSLGFLNLTGNSLIEEHLVYLDENSKEVDGEGKVYGVRISSNARKTFDKELIVTDLNDIILLTDLIFKLDESLAKMAKWYEVFKKNPDPNLKTKFYEGMFGSEETLIMLTENGPKSVRTQITDFKLALSLLLTKYAKPTGKDAEGKVTYTCYNKLSLDPVTGVETPSGECSLQRGPRLQTQQELWRQALRLVGRAYQSPLFIELGRN